MRRFGLFAIGWVLMAGLCRAGQPAAQTPHGRSHPACFGPFHLPVERFGPPFTLTMAAVRTPRDAAHVLEAAQAKGVRVLIHLTGGRRHFQNADGSFSLDRFAQLLDQFRGLDFAPWIRNGTLIGHMLFDEPHDPTNWDGKPVPFATIESAAAASKRLWPNLPTAIGSPAQYLSAGAPYKHLDFSFAQYSAKRGDLDTWRRDELAHAQKAGLKPLFGLNVLRGAGRDQPLSAEQLRRFGTALVREPVSHGLLMWKWDEEYFSRPDIRQAMEEIRAAVFGVRLGNGISKAAGHVSDKGVAERKKAGAP
ncbi:MAG: hypothetical protein N3B01_04960 [Verrucomicrobiae bacterium]|nr:hypothetical protein [Verrucomicrobiae bacterium]